MKLLMSVLEEGSSKIIYETTTRGRNFLDAYGKLEELMRARCERGSQRNEGTIKET